LNVQTEKIALAKRLLETDDEAVLLEIKEVFESHERIFRTTCPGCEMVLSVPKNKPVTVN
jgi:hypothetical protein